MHPCSVDASAPRLGDVHEPYQPRTHGVRTHMTRRVLHEVGREGELKKLHIGAWIDIGGVWASVGLGELGVVSCTGHVLMDHGL